MKTPALAAASLAVLLALAGTSRAQEAKWLTSYEEALKKSKAEKKPILANFTGSDDKWCQKFQDEVLKTKEFVAWAKRRVILLELDYPHTTDPPADLKKQNDDLKSKFRVKTLPTIVFLDAEGKEKGRTGVLDGGPKAWTDNADGILGAAEAGAAPKDEGAGWLDSWDKAAEKAKADKKVVIVDFTSSDGGDKNQKLKKEVFDTDEFKKWAAERAILVELDFPKKNDQSDETKAANKKVKDKYGVTNFPTVLILDADGKKLGTLGYEEGGAAKWTKKAQGFIDKKK